MSHRQRGRAIGRSAVGSFTGLHAQVMPVDDPRLDESQEETSAVCVARTVVEAVQTQQEQSARYALRE